MYNKVRAIFLPVVFAATLLSAVNCGGGGGGSTTPELEVDFFRATDVVVKPEVVVLPNTVVISDVTPTSVTVSGAPTIVIGSVIVSGEGAGMMRKVTGVTPSVGDLILETEDASLTDIFVSAKIDFRRELKESDVQENQILVAGAQVGNRGRAVGAGFPITIPKTFVGETDGQTKIGVEVEASGNLGIALSGSIVITAANGLEKLSLGFGSSWTGTHGFSLVGETEFFKKEVPFAVKIFSPIPLGSVGPIPIVILPVVSLQVAAVGSTKGGWETAGTGTSTFAGVMAYRQIPLGSPMSSSQFDLTTIANTSGTFSTSNFFWDLTFDVTPVELEIATSLDGVIGPTLKIDAPAAAINLKRIPLNNSTTVSADAIFRAKVGAEAGMLGFSLPLFELTAVEKKFNIYTKTFKPGDGDVGVH